MSQSPHRGPTVFDEATLRFFRVPASEIEYEEEEEQQQKEGEDQSPPRGTVRSLRKNLDLISLIACRRQGVVPQQLGIQESSPSSSSSSKSKQQQSSLTWAHKQHLLGLLRVLTLERARVASEISEVLKKDNDPHARQRMEHEVRLVSEDVGSSNKKGKGGGGHDRAEEDPDELPFFVADPDEAELVAELLSTRGSNATTAAIQERLITAVKRRSEKALARMMRQHDRIVANETEQHQKRVEMLEYLHERDAVREKQKKERQDELHQRAASQAQIREEKMKTLRIRHAVINNQRKEELLDKQRQSEELHDRAQQKQIESLVQRCAVEHQKILSVQDRVAQAKLDEERRRHQMEEERRQRSSVTEERRSALELNRDYRLERRKQRHELQQMRAQNAREERQEQLRGAFDDAHRDQLVKTHDAIKLAHSNKAIVAQRQRGSQNGTPTAAAAAGSRPVSKRSERSVAGESSGSNPNAAAHRSHSRTEDRRRAEREEVLRRAIELKAKEQREEELLEERKIDAEAARRVRMREEEMRLLHNRENLKRKERADAHRHQLQQQLVDEQAAAAAQREQERLRAERRLQTLKLDLQRQREEAQEAIRTNETKAHLNRGSAFDEESQVPASLTKETQSSRAHKAKSNDGSGDDGDENDGRPARANAQNSSILATIGDRGKKRAQY